MIEGIGGENGWYSTPLLWAIRGWMDRLVGGIGLARGRRSRARLEVGDALDFWRVEAIERGSFLRLRAEMKVPGLAWLELRASRGGRRIALRPARGVLPAGSRRAAVLVGGAAVPRLHLPRHGEPYCGDRRTRGPPDGCPRRVSALGPDVLFRDRAIDPLGDCHHPAAAFELTDHTSPTLPDPNEIG